jgi:1,4-dihydroxy-2-naphthoyl-CoA hydrolase
MQQEQALASLIARANARTRGTFIELAGIRLLAVSQTQVTAAMSFTPNVQQLTGVFHAGALLTLADTTATFASMYWDSGQIEGTAERFPFTIQLSANFIRNTDQGTVTAVAVPLHRGRTTMVVETRVSDAQGRLLIVVTTTHLFVDR